MKMTLQVVIEDEDHHMPPMVKEVFRLERKSEELCPETLGLKLDEAKDVLAELQTALVTTQAARFLEEQSFCTDCGMPYPKNGIHQLTFRTLFGTIKLASQRFYTCACSQAKARRQGQKQISFSPLANLLSKRTAPEFVYLQTKWASVMSYGRTAELLEEVLPLEKRISTAVLSKHVQHVATRLDSELGDEQWCFIEGCQQEWEQLPEPGEPLIVGIDGGYVHAREGQNRKAGFFEIIVGKSMTSEQPWKRFGFVNTYETKPKRRLYEALKAQGMQMNQHITFLSDGGDDVRNLQLYLSPFAEYILDWFHITMRLTVLGQLAKGISLKTEPKTTKKKQKQGEKEEEAFSSFPTLEEVAHQLERMKWYLWHGNVFRASQIGEDLEEDLEMPEEKHASVEKMLRAVREFNGYLTANESYIVNYGDRYRNGEIISTAFVESTVNEVISKRFVKKQQMRWTKKGAHNILQIRVQVLNDDLYHTFCKWYPAMIEPSVSNKPEKAA
ncbi:MAG TPA: ISKra4 family transposase [Ktedonobacteraceae bacterium]|nr:ISKra4 family transposase [Ktedonobacteraceae bacterium]